MTDHTTKERWKESIKINQSLFTLSMVVEALNAKKVMADKVERCHKA